MNEIAQKNTDTVGAWLGSTGGVIVVVGAFLVIAWLMSRGKR